MVVIRLRLMLTRLPLEIILTIGKYRTRQDKKLTTLKSKNSILHTI